MSQKHLTHSSLAQVVYDQVVRDAWRKAPMAFAHCRLKALEDAAIIIGPDWLWKAESTQLVLIVSGRRSS